MSKNRGFTLAEVLVTTAIMSILAAVALPSYQQYKRTTVQFEAKTMLAEVYTTQHTYNTTHMRYQPNLKTAGFLPAGPIRYNIGAIWPGSSDSHKSLYTSTQNICKACNGNETNDGACCMLSRFSYSKHGSTTLADTTKPCFGNKGGVTSEFISDDICGGGFSVKNSDIGASEYTENDGEFYYYATGCVSEGRRDPETLLDVWMISNRKHLVNVKNAATGATTCSH